MIDLRSDTVTTPTEDMRRAMAAAPVGDDVYGEDPTVRRLEEMAAAVVGKPAACLMPSGTMANLASLMASAPRGGKVVVGADSDLYLYEAGGASVCGGLVLAPVANRPDGGLDDDQLDAELAIDRDDPQLAIPAVISVEDTHSRCGGRALELSYLAALHRQARAAGATLHLDGARLFNAAHALGVPAAAVAAHADSLQFCLSKGLCAPIGSVVAGSADFVVRARRVRKMLGGGMRQAGVIAAAGIVALDSMVARLADDHETAAQLARGLRSMPAVAVDPDVTTNIVMFRVHSPHLTQAAFIAAMGERGVRLSELGHGRIRAVTHAGTPAADIDRVLDLAGQVLDAAAARWPVENQRIGTPA